MPLFKLPARSQLQFHYFHEIKKEGACKDVLLDNVRGTVEPDSTIDITGFSHFLAMPDLAAFGNSGFPFSRLADLSESAVVLAAQARARRPERLPVADGPDGQRHRLPAHAVTVALATAKSTRWRTRTFWSSPAAPTRSLLEQWASHLPFSLKADSKGFRLSGSMLPACSTGGT